jgi:hypothetical protein
MGQAFSYEPDHCTVVNKTPPPPADRFNQLVDNNRQRHQPLHKRDKGASSGALAARIKDDDSPFAQARAVKLKSDDEQQLQRVVDVVFAQQHAGGRRSRDSRLRLTHRNADIVHVRTEAELAPYRDAMTRAAEVAEKNDPIDVALRTPHETFWLALHRESTMLVGFMKTTDMEQFKGDAPNFVEAGGIEELHGLQISELCNGHPQQFSNVATLLLEQVEAAAVKAGYQYLLLHAGADREYLVGDGSGDGGRPGLYVKHGFAKVSFLRRGEFADIDVWSMRKMVGKLV